jgi:hypothetical protein
MEPEPNLAPAIPMKTVKKIAKKPVMSKEKKYKDALEEIFTIAAKATFLSNQSAECHEIAHISADALK